GENGAIILNRAHKKLNPLINKILREVLGARAVHRKKREIGYGDGGPLIKKIVAICRPFP
ncbi:MAG: hypothetical protein KBC64_06895, partial [Simkaniaceae bacterium]|nr:hypothetical protein [Simkaniaceae bacterium]